MPTDPPDPEKAAPLASDDEKVRMLEAKERQIEKLIQLFEGIDARLQRIEEAGGLSLPSRNEYATIPGMSTAQIVAPVKKRRGPPSSGVVVDVQNELGFASMQELADELGKKAATLRSWNNRSSIPAGSQAKIDRLRASRKPRKA